MSGYRFQQLEFAWPEQLTAGMWLWVWNADKIPPHLAVSTGDSYFSLTYKDCEIAKSVKAMVRKAKRAKIPLVLIDLSFIEPQHDFTAIFQQYEGAAINRVTCLTPIKQVFGFPETIGQLSELLTELERTGKLSKVFALHLTSDYHGIPAYSVSDIMQRIEQLHDANRSESPIASR